MYDLIVAPTAAKIPRPALAAGFLAVHLRRSASVLPLSIHTLVDMSHGSLLVLHEPMARE